MVRWLLGDSGLVCGKGHDGFKVERLVLVLYPMFVSIDILGLYILNDLVNTSAVWKI